MAVITTRNPLKLTKEEIRKLIEIKKEQKEKENRRKQV